MPKPTPQDWLQAPGLTESVRALARRGDVRTYRKGALLIREGEPGDTLYIVLAGRLRVYSSSAANEREFTHGVYGVGEYVGEMGLDGGPRSASVCTLETAVCAMVARRSLEAHLNENPQFAFELLAKVIRRARAATISAKQMALNDNYTRLKLLLDERAVTQPDATRVVAPRLTQRGMAELIGCTDKMVGRILKDLVTGGYLIVERELLRLLKVLPAEW